MTEVFCCEMGCRPSRNSLGRVADSTSEYNRCYLKDFDKARRKQKKSTRGGRRRTPTYNAFSSTTKCYERDKGASKITVRLSTDGSMLEIEQFDIEYSPADDFISESTNEDRGIEMKPFGVESTSFDTCFKKRFSYGRSDSAPVLRTDGITDVSRQPEGDGHEGGIRESDSTCWSEDSINNANQRPNNTEDKSSSVITVNVHKHLPETTPSHERLDYSIEEVPTERKMSDTKYLGAGSSHCVGLVDNETHYETNRDNIIQSVRNEDRRKISWSENRSKRFIHHCSKDFSGNDPIPYVHYFKTDHYVSTLTEPNTDENCKKAIINVCEKCAKTNPPCEEDECLSGGLLKNPCTIDTGLSKFNSFSSVKSDKDIIVAGHTNKEMDNDQISKLEKRKEYNKNQNDFDRFSSHCFVCEKEDWRNTELCAYINYKYNTSVPPKLQNCGTDSNANVCCSRRLITATQGKTSCVHNCLEGHEECSANFLESGKNTAYNICETAPDDRVEGNNIYQDQILKFSSTQCFNDEKRRHYSRKETNPITGGIDLAEKKLCKGLLGQKTLSPNRSVALSSDNVQSPQCFEKSMSIHRQNGHLDNSCRENKNHNKCIGHTCSARQTSEIEIDNFKSVTMETNSASETTFRNDEHLRCYHHVSAMEELTLGINSYNNGKEILRLLS